MTTSSKISSAPNSSHKRAHLGVVVALDRPRAALRPERLDQHRGGAAGQPVAAELAAQRVEIVGVDLLGPGGRAAGNADRLHAAGARQAHAVDELVAPAVIGAADLDDPALAGEGARQPHRRHHRLGAGAEQPQHLDSRHEAVDQLGEPQFALVQQAGDRAALVERLLDRGAHGGMIGAEQRRPARLQEVGVAVAVDVGEIGAFGARHRQRERMIEGEVVLHPARDEALGLVGERLRADAALIEIAHHFRQAVGPERADRLAHQLLEAPIERVDVGPLGNAIACGHERSASASAMSSRTRARPAFGSGLERMRRRNSASEACSSAATRAVVSAGSAPQHRAPWLSIR